MRNLIFLLLAFVVSSSQSNCLAETSGSVSKEEKSLFQTSKITLSSAEKQAVIEAASKVSSSIRERFQTLLTAWNNAIKTNPAMLISSDTKDYTKLPEFAPLKAMGKGIIPLIMKELLNENNFYLLPLYDAIQEDSLQRIVLDTNSAEILGGEQYRAKKTIQLWLKNNRK